MQLSVLLALALFANPLAADDSIRAEKVLTLSDTLATHEIFEPRALTTDDDFNHRFDVRSSCVRG